MKTAFHAAGLTVLAVTAAGCQRQENKEESRPNIVLILADDIGKECFGCYGSATYSTPCIDSLAKRSVRYDHMHAMPLSTPSRVQLMTGLYNDSNYVAFGYMNDDEHTFAHLAQQAGYATAIVGKWQLGRSRDMVRRLGFDEYCLSQLEIYKELVGENSTDRYAFSYLDNNGHYDFSYYGPDDAMRYACDFIDRQCESGQPFLLYYPTPLVHTPHVATPDSESWVTEPSSRFTADTRHFPDMVSYLDKQVGQIVDKLEERGIMDNTILIFMGDNGTTPKIVSTMKDGTEVRGGKGSPKSNGTAVPLLISWGDRIKEGRVSDRLVDLTDFMPTLADAMGVEVPSEWNTEGISLYPELCGDTPLEREFTLMHFNPLFPLRPWPQASRCAFDKEWKYYWDGRFYHYSEDPEEENPVDVATCSPDVQKLYARMKERVDRHPGFTPDEPGAPRRGNYFTFYDMPK
ncbi:MAG: sulfatase-like hydrolase/transferase [Muribaculaceae bacterium]|nr:sulfatase-like hydrolase/transferase [Muribaculaceae bacterium]